MPSAVAAVRKLRRPKGFMSVSPVFVWCGVRISAGPAEAPPAGATHFVPSESETIINALLRRHDAEGAQNPPLPHGIKSINVGVLARPSPIRKGPPPS
ncbi:hypothetical protein Aph02nite_22400 [Actinoplanes philippinensis]|nr:hypothetical protein Aph02nite_22400 [Actinoplanes philippinensis]